MSARRFSCPDEGGAIERAKIDRVTHYKMLAGEWSIGAIGVLTFRPKWD
ncbi:MAG: hypothetical protein F6J93_14550 [Oscillatoria sp. SIO1A7]|nr:hypothetical protein [Oscillatoria sp. SIO1A7]